jgi:serine protease Do
MNLNAQTNNNADQIFSQQKELILKVSVLRDSMSAKASYGSGFPIQNMDKKNGLVITNYHVVSQFIMNRNDYNIFVTIGSEQFSAELLAFDIPHDLALLKVNFHFPKVIKISPHAISQGEKVFSLGFPKDLPVTIVEGIYNGIVKNGYYQEIHLSSGINSGMSGGPTLNQKGDLIGVNVSTMINSQNMSFAVPAHFVQKLLENQKLHLTDTNHEITRQIMDAQNNLFQDFISHNQSFTQFKQWRIVKLPEYLKCWQNIHKQSPHHKFEIEELSCHLQNMSRINESINTAYYTIEFYIFKNNGLNPFQYFNQIAESIQSPRDITGLFDGFKQRPHLTRAECDSLYIKNRYKIPLKINFCFQAYLASNQMVDAFIDIVTLTKGGNDLVISSNFFGFDVANIKRIAYTLADNISL